MEYIARIHSDFPTKFGIPRQSGLTDALISKIVFEPKFRNPDCLRGIEQWSHLWLLWHFDRIEDGLWSPTVAPPKLGGKTRVGVFATRSPFRPNPIGLSSVKLAGVELHTKTVRFSMLRARTLPTGRQSTTSSPIFRMPIRIRTRWTPFLRAGTPRRLPSSSRTRCWKRFRQKSARG